VIWDIVFYLTATIMLISSAALLFVREPMHAALYLIASLIALALVFYLLGSPFVAVMQIILYVGAIMVLFVFLIMMLGPQARVRLDARFRRGFWWPILLLAILAQEGALLLAVRSSTAVTDKAIVMIGPKAVGQALFTDYLLMVQVAALLLLAALAAVLYFGRKAAR